MKADVVVRMGRFGVLMLVTVWMIGGSAAVVDADFEERCDEL